jgi:hypothetical protein
MMRHKICAWLALVPVSFSANAGWASQPIDPTSPHSEARRKLTSRQIVRAVSGRQFAPKAREGVTVQPYVETFSKTGEWVSWRNMRAMTKREGRWFVQDDSLCVQGTTGRTSCREVFAADGPGQVFFQDAWTQSGPPLLMKGRSADVGSR